MHCYLCNNDKFECISDQLRYESSKKAYRCLHCGLVFLDPLMTQEEEQQFYEKEYGEIFSSEKGTTPEKLFNSRLGDAKIYFDWTKPYLNKNNSCLEIGCASGYYLATIRDSVRSVAGIESHTLLKNYCRQLGITMKESVDTCPDNHFDRIFLFFLLEHIGDPLPFLANIKRVLKDDGMLFIIVPNAGDALLTLYEIPAFRKFYFTPAHQYYYTKSTLSDLLKKAGFENFEIHPRQRYDLSNHMHWMQYGRPGGVGKYNHIFSQQLLDEYAKSLTDHFLCDTLFAVIKK